MKISNACDTINSTDGFAGGRCLNRPEDGQMCASVPTKCLYLRKEGTQMSEPKIENTKKASRGRKFLAAFGIFLVTIGIFLAAFSISFKILMLPEHSANGESSEFERLEIENSRLEEENRRLEEENNILKGKDKD